MLYNVVLVSAVQQHNSAMKSGSVSYLVMSGSLRPCGLCPTRLFSPWDSPGKSTQVGCHALLQGIFPTEGSDLYLLCLLHLQVGVYGHT